MRTIKILPADSLEEEKESIGQPQQVSSDNDGDDGNAEMASNQIHLKEKTFQDGDSENNLTQLVLKFIETIGFFLIVRMPLILKFIVIIPLNFYAYNDLDFDIVTGNVVILVYIIAFTTIYWLIGLVNYS